MIKQNYSLRDALESDSLGLSELAIKTFVETYTVMNPHHQELYTDYASERFNPKEIMKAILNPQYKFKLLFSEQRLVGYTKIIFGSESLELEKLYLLKDFKGQGLGKMLLSQVLEDARHRGIKSVTLGVYDQNSEALSFYERLGFRKIGERDFLYQWKETTYKDRDWILEIKL